MFFLFINNFLFYIKQFVLENFYKYNIKNAEYYKKNKKKVKKFFNTLNYFK